MSSRFGTRIVIGGSIAVVDCDVDGRTHATNYVTATIEGTGERIQIPVNMSVQLASMQRDAHGFWYKHH